MAEKVRNGGGLRADEILRTWIFLSSVLVLSLIALHCGESSEAKVPKPALEPLYLLGRSVYKRECRSCHSLGKVGGVSGPALDELARNMEGALIREAVIEPGRKIKGGYPDIMPRDFAQRLKEKELDAMIYYLTNGETYGWR